MTYNVFGGTLNPAQLQLRSVRPSVSLFRFTEYFPSVKWRYTRITVSNMKGGGVPHPNATSGDISFRHAIVLQWSPSYNSRM